MSSFFSSTIRNDYPSLQNLCAEASVFLNTNAISGDAAYAIDLALEELITNIIKYGYDDDAIHDINVQITITGERILLIIKDDGHIFDPTAAPRPDVEQTIEERPIGGLGIHLVRNTCESIKYRRDEEKNIVEVAVSLTQKT